MAEQERGAGLKLAMLVQPASQPSTRSGIPGRSGNPTLGRVFSAPQDVLSSKRVPASERFAADMLDLFITLPIAAVLLFGLPVLLGLLTLANAPPDSDAGYEVAGAFFLMVPLCVPLAALICTGLAYLTMRNTPGKRLKSLTVQRKGGGAVSRKRLVSRCLFKWGLFTDIFFLGSTVGLILVAIGSVDVIFSGGAILSSLVIASLVLVFILIADRVLPLTRFDGKSLTDVITGTEVTWRTQAVEAQITDTVPR